MNLYDELSYEFFDDRIPKSYTHILTCATLHAWRLHVPHAPPASVEKAWEAPFWEVIQVRV
jgi:hypothetical protein